MNRCAACPGTNNCVPPSGPTDVDIVFCGEAPGKDENRKGIPFIGKTGREVNEHYLPLAGMRRDATYWTNSIKCLPVSSDGRLDIKRQKDLDLLQSCAETHLYQEIDSIRPKLIVPMGAFACRAIDPDINLDLHHGMPIETRMGMTFPMWHPAGGVHEPKKMLQIRTDWTRLRQYLHGTLYVPVDEYPNPDYAEVTQLSEIMQIDPTIPMSADTESSRKLGPYFLTYSQIPGTGRLIRASRKDLLAALQFKLNRWESILLFHNWLYDKRVTLDMGVRFPDQPIRDTMIRAFHLGNLPQGLKALSYRELGMEMQDFFDLVYPYSKDVCIDYIRDAYSQDYERPPEDLVRGDDGKWKTYRPQSIYTKIKRFYSDLAKNPNLDILARWDNWESSHNLIEEKCGEWPALDIAHVPFEESLIYACRDADATLRLHPILERMAQMSKSGLPQEKWRDIQH